MNQSTFGSWFLVFGAWVLGPIVFLIHRARIWGCARGGSRATFLGPFAFIRPNNFVFDTLFVRFWLHLGCQDDPQNPQKSSKSRVRNCTAFWINFRTDFYRFFLQFSTPCEGKNQAKTMEGCSFLHFSHFRLVFPSGLDFGPSWAPFWSGFGLLFLTFFASKGDKKINDFSHHFFYEFGSILAPKMALGRGRIAGKSPPRGGPRSSWRRCCDFLSLLASF